jgi:hypothetical protein
VLGECFLLSALAMPVSAAFAAGAPEQGSEQAPDARRLLRLCRQADALLNRASIRGTIEQTNSPPVNGEAGQKDTFILRRDGDRLDVSGLLKRSNSVQPVRYRFVINDGLLVSYNFLQNRATQRPSSGMVGAVRPSGMSERVERQLGGILLQGGRELDGYIPVTGAKHISDLLMDASELRIRGQESIDQVVCQVVVGTTPYGGLAVWIAPDKGYHVLKYQMERGADDQYAGGRTFRQWHVQYTISGNPETLVGVSCVLDGVEFLQKPDGLAPIAGRLTNRHHLASGTDFVLTSAIRRTEVDLNPKFEGTDAFLIDLPEGVDLFNLDDQSGVKYLWRGGKAVKGFAYYKPNPEDFMPDPSARRSGWMMWASILGGCAALVLGLGLIWRARRRSAA